MNERVESGNKVTIEDSSWRVTIEHINVWTGTSEDLYELVKTAFIAQFSNGKEYFDE